MTFTIHPPQIVWLLFVFAEISLAIAKHGQPKPSPNFHGGWAIFNWLLLTAAPTFPEVLSTQR